MSCVQQSDIRDRMDLKSPSLRISDMKSDAIPYQFASTDSEDYFHPFPHDGAQNSMLRTLPCLSFTPLSSLDNSVQSCDSSSSSGLPQNTTGTIDRLPSLASDYPSSPSFNEESPSFSQSYPTPATYPDPVPHRPRSALESEKYWIPPHVSSALDLPGLDPVEKCFHPLLQVGQGTHENDISSTLAWFPAHSAVATETEAKEQLPSPKENRQNICAASPRSVCKSGKRFNKSSTNASSLQRKPKLGGPLKYECIFSLYGCGRTFKCKNEWKRHINTQHLESEQFVCTFGSCEKNIELLRGHDHSVHIFNRKDLFISHLRRHHDPARPYSYSGHDAFDAHDHKSIQQTHDKFEAGLQSMCDICYLPGRQPPAGTRCTSCNMTFCTWAGKLEHLGQHFGKCHEPIHEEDPALRNWAIQEGILIPDPRGHRGPKRWVIAKKSRANQAQKSRCQHTIG